MSGLLSSIKIHQQAHCQPTQGKYFFTAPKFGARSEACVELWVSNGLHISIYIYINVYFLYENLWENLEGTKRSYQFQPNAKQTVLILRCWPVAWSPIDGGVLQGVKVVSPPTSSCSLLTPQQLICCHKDVPRSGRAGWIGVSEGIEWL